MYKPAGIGKMYGDTLTPAKGRISNTLIAFFILIKFGFGLDCGFVSWFNKKYRCFLKFVLLIVSSWVLLVKATSLKQIDKMTIGWLHIMFLFHYGSSVLMLRFTKISVYDFLIKINLLSCETDRKSKEIIGAIGIMYMITVIVTKLPLTLSYCAEVADSYCDAYLVPLFVVAFYTYCADVVPIIMAVIMYHQLKSVKNVRHTLKKPEINVDVTKKLYIAVANVIDGIRPLYHNMLMVKLITELPQLLTSMWFLVRCIKTEAGFVRFIGEFIFVLHAVFQIFLPAVIAEMVKAEVEDIKLELYNHMMVHEDDVKLSTSVQNLLSYMDVRRLEHLAWRFVPVDLRLPISLFSLCTTYFIVILQFTHLVE